MLRDPEGLNRTTERIIGAAISVHRAFGPGLLESAYREALRAELQQRGLSFRSECDIPIEHLGVRLGVGYRADLIVEEVILVELKAVHAIVPVHLAQLKTYVKLSGCRVGLLINFNVSLLKDGIRRVLHPDVGRLGDPTAGPE